MPRTLVVAGVGLLLLTAACEVPGTSQLAQGLRCVTPAQRSAPPLAATAFQPVWRTYTGGIGRLSVTIPDTWGGVFTGTGHVDHDLADVAARLPPIAGHLRQTVETLDSSYRFMAESSQMAAAVYVSLTAPNGTSKDCELATTTSPPPDTVRAFHGRLAGAWATELVELGPPQDPATEPHLFLEFFVTPAGGRARYRVEFSMARSLGADVEPIAWRIAASLAVGAGASPAVCLFPDQTEPGVGRPAGLACPVAVGDRLSRLDCPPSGAIANGARIFDPAADKVLGEMDIDSSGGSCAVAVQPGLTASIDPDGTASQAVVVVDFWMPDLNNSGVGLALRAQPQSSVYADLYAVDRLAILERTAGVTRTTLSSDFVTPFGSRPHRFVLAMSGSEVRAWVDGAGYGPVTTSVPADASRVQLFFSNPSTVTATFRFQGLVAYALPAGPG